MWITEIATMFPPLSKHTIAIILDLMSTFTSANGWPEQALFNCLALDSLVLLGTFFLFFFTSSGWGTILVESILQVAGGPRRKA